MNNNLTELLDTLKSLHIFKNLDKDEILEILKISEIKKFNENISNKTEKVSKGFTVGELKELIKELLLTLI